MSAFNINRKLRKIPAKKKVAGVCAGFAYWLGIETWVVRVIWTLLILVNGFGLFAYVLFWIILDKRDQVPPDFDEVTGD